MAPRRRLHPGAVDLLLDGHPEKVRRAVHALIAQGVATEENIPGISGIGRVCRMYGHRIYGSIPPS